MVSERSVLSIKDLNQMVKDLLADAIGQVWLMGEISNFSRPSSGHWYFTLKDEAAQVRCAMFRNSNFKTGFVPQNGQQVLVRATVTLYEARGEYQLVLDKIQPAGSGLLQQKYEQLKQKLSDEGLFDPAYKKALPDNIRTVGIITSSTGAALYDICQILKRRDPSLQIIIYPTQVQGNEATMQITRMIEIANSRAECDVLIVGRGGGSLEDLWCFNEESVARAIFASKLPIVSAVGHEVDFTIADFVADMRAATPSAAAELVSRDKLEQLKRMQGQEQHLLMAMDYYLMRSREVFTQLHHRLQTQHPQAKLEKQHSRLLQVKNLLGQRITQQLHNQSNLHTRLDKKLHSLSPINKLVDLRQRLDRSKQTAIMLMQQRLVDNKHHLILAATQLNSISPQAKLEKQRGRLLHAKNLLGQHITQQLRNQSNRHTILDKKLRSLSPLPKLTNLRQRFELSKQSVLTLMQQRLGNEKQHLALAATQLNTVSPLATLERGYSVTRNNQSTVIRTANQIAVGEVITTQLKQGKLISQVTKVEE